MPPLVHLAIAQFKPRKADFRANLERLGALFAQLGDLEPHPNVLALPETALTGYFLEGGVREEAMTAGALARELDTTYRSAVRSPRALDVTLGFYEIWNNKLYNSAMYVTLGNGEPEIRHVHRKMFLPTYGLFDEERFVERGTEVRAFDTSWGRAAMLVCEDAWHSMTATIAALDGAQIIFVCSVTPARADMPLVADLEVMAPHLAASLEAVRNRVPAMLRYDGPSCEPTIEDSRAVSAKTPSRPKKSAVSEHSFPIVTLPTMGQEPTPLAIDASLTADWLTEF